MASRPGPPDSDLRNFAFLEKTTGGLAKGGPHLGCEFNRFLRDGHECAAHLRLSDPLRIRLSLDWASHRFFYGWIGFGELEHEPKIGKNSEIINSKILGPVIIGNKVRIIDSYIGPFTSLSDGVEIKKSEIEYSVVIDGTKIDNIRGRMQKCLIGKDVRIYHSKDLPLVYEFILGDHSKVGLL